MSMVSAGHVRVPYEKKEVEVMRKHAIILISLFASSVMIMSPCQAKKIKTGFKADNLSKDNIYIGSEEDGMCFAPDSTLQSSFHFSGFDKKGTSSVENFFVTNRSEKFVKSLYLRISYFMPDGRLLHRRLEKIDCNLPAGETRNVEIKSWDRQHSFYYVKSLGQHKSATPFDVTIDVVNVIF